jgi:hypothetical protein
MTNKISSAQDAISALMKLKQKSVPVRVNISFPHTIFSFEGEVIGADLEVVQVELVCNGKEAALFRIAPIRYFDFIGGFADTQDTSNFYLTIVRKGKFSDLNVPRITLNAQMAKSNFVN